LHSLQTLYPAIVGGYIAVGYTTCSETIIDDYLSGNCWHYNHDVLFAATFMEFDFLGVTIEESALFKKVLFYLFST
jgi:hypothetical protein